jgi:hypothetical protein
MEARLKASEQDIIKHKQSLTQLMEREIELDK